MPSFPKSSRILKKSEFDLLLKRGKQRGNACFALRWQKGLKRRLGIVVSRKIGSAARRNRIKRLLREFFRLNPEKFPLGDAIVIARGGVNVLSNSALLESLESLLKK